MTTVSTYFCRNCRSCDIATLFLKGTFNIFCFASIFNISYREKAQRRGSYSGLLLSGELKKHLLMIREQGEERFDLLVAQMVEKEGETEKLKVQDQILWVQRMNCIRSRAEEIVREEIIYIL